MKLVKDGIERIIEGNDIIQIFKDAGWQEVKEQIKEEIKEQPKPLKRTKKFK